MWSLFTRAVKVASPQSVIPLRTLVSCVSRVGSPKVGEQWATVCVQAVRGKKKNTYQPSAWKRINKHGIHQKLYSESGIHTLWRRFLKGRHRLAPFERILKGTKNGKILP